MGLFDKLKKAFDDGTGDVGEAPSEQFPTQIALIRAALERYYSLPQDGGYWLTFEVGDQDGKHIGVVEVAEDRINLCHRDDINVAELLGDAGRHDLVERVRIADDGLVRVEGANKDDLSLAIDLIVVGGLRASGNYRVGAVIQA